MELINVLVKFSQNKVQPVAFNRAGRTYKVKSVNLVHHFREGDQTIFIFHVSDEANTYRLRLETDILRWYLEE